jgi:hypothetical protein
MLKRIIICAALVTPSAVFAADLTPGDQPNGSEKDLCNDLGTNEAACHLRPDICFWDTSDKRCEWIIDPQHCATYPENVCRTVAGCFWDTSDVRCERLL